MVEKYKHVEQIAKWQSGESTYRLLACSKYQSYKVENYVIEQKEVDTLGAECWTVRDEWPIATNDSDRRLCTLLVDAIKADKSVSAGLKGRLEGLEA